MTGNRAQRAKDILLPLVLIVATLYFAREFFIPLALAILLSFVLAPIVWKFEQWHFGRIGSVVTVTILTFAVLGGFATIFGILLLELANTLPKYQTELHHKILALKVPQNSRLTKASETLKELSRELNSPSETVETTTVSAG